MAPPAPRPIRRAFAGAAGVFAVLAACSASGDPPPEPPPVQPPAGPLAFPGAVGHGAGSAGGRGGRVIAVTTLADGGAGSLRACIDAQGPRTCVFRVAGLIRFTARPPTIRNPFLTIAGQTAPGGGITLAHAGGAEGLTPLVIKRTHDVIVRHLRIRPDRAGINRGGQDAVTIEDSRNVIVDHVSASWALDENVNGQGANDRVTVSWSIFAEGIPRHDKCALLASDPAGPQRFSFVGNLCAHNGDRNPDINFPPGSCVEVVNNLFYNAGSQFAEVWESQGGTPVSLVGNLFRAGPDTGRTATGIDLVAIESAGPARVCLYGNRFEGAFVHHSPLLAARTVAAPDCPLTAPPLAAADAAARVLASAGAFPRDAVDRRIAGEASARTGRIGRAPGPIPVIAAGKAYPDADGDGMDDRWEAAHGADPTRFDAWETAGRDGLANLDAFLDHLHRQLVSAGAART